MAEAQGKSNRKRFEEVYLEELLRAKETEPHLYRWDAARARDFIEIMVDDLARGTSSVRGQILKRVCTRLGVAQDHGAIREFLTKECKQ